MGVLRRAVGNFIAWAVVENDGANKGRVPTQQIRSFDQAGLSVEWYPYGFFATAMSGSPAVRFMMSEQADALAHMPGSPEDRPAHKPGEVGVYHPETGSFVIFREDGTVDVLAKADLVVNVTGSATVNAATVNVVASVSATVTAPAIVADGPVNVTGDLDQDGPLLGFRGSAPVAKPIINGTKTGGTAQNQLLVALELMGLIDDQT